MGFPQFIPSQAGGGRVNDGKFFLKHILLSRMTHRTNVPLGASKTLVGLLL